VSSLKIFNQIFKFLINVVYLPRQKAMAMLGQHSQFDSLLSPASDEKMMLQQ